MAAVGPPGRPGRYAGHPAFAPVAAIYAEAIVANFSTPSVVGRLLPQHIGFRLMAAVTWRHLAALRRGESAATPAALKRLGFASPRTIAALIQVFRALGLFTIERAESDRRQRWVRPTERIMIRAEGWIACGFAAIDALGGSGYTARRLAEPGFGHDVMLTTLDTFFTGAFDMLQHPEIAFFARRDCGYPILLRLMARHLTRAGEAPTISELARQFGVSRGHVRNLATDADRVGLIRFDGPARLLAPTPLLAAAFDAWIDRLLTFIADHADAVAARRAPPT